MRLIVRTTLWYSLFAIFVFGIGGVVSFVLVRDAIQRETDWELIHDLYQIKKLLRVGIDAEHLQSHNIKITPLDSNQVWKQDSVFSDTLIYLKRTQKLESFRKLTVTKPISNRFYTIELVNIIFEQDDIFEVVSQIILRLFLFMILALFIGSILISKQLLLPFQHLLQSIDQFSLKTNKDFPLPETNIKEFKQLNSFLERMTQKARKDYQTLKEFSENASHEMQTPIAIAQGKLEILQQREDVNEAQLELISQAQKSIFKLSKLGNALALLAKIENHEFSTAKEVNFSSIVQNTTHLFQELAELQGITITHFIEPDIHIKMDETLADVLITNLLKNAIQHNIDNGWIELKLDHRKLSVKNSGKPLNIPTEELFTRFRKNNQSGGSLGLGLAIVQKIISSSGLSIDYQYKSEGQTHEVSLLL